MGSADEQIDVSGRTALEAVQACFENWGKGKYAGEGGDKALAVDVAEVCEVDSSGGYEWKHATGYKKYSGLSGFMDWLNYLLQLDFPDFAVDSMEPGEKEGTVKAQVSYTPYCKVTMKTCPEKCVDTHLWTVVEGKVTSVVFTWGKPELGDALWAQTDAEKAVTTCIMNWGSGKFAGEDGRKISEESCTADVVIDATGGKGYEWKNTEGYKVYEGLDGWMGWLEFLQGCDFPGFTVKNCTDQGDGTVKTEMSAPTTCKATKKETGPWEISCIWTVTEGKISKGAFTWQDDAVLDGIFAA